MALVDLQSDDAYVMWPLNLNKPILREVPVEPTWRIYTRSWQQVSNIHAGPECQLLRRLRDETGQGNDGFDLLVSAIILIRLLVLRQLHKGQDRKDNSGDGLARWQFLVDVTRTNSASSAFNYDSGIIFTFNILIIWSNRSPHPFCWMLIEQ